MTQASGEVSPRSLALMSRSPWEGGAVPGRSPVAVGLKGGQSCAVGCEPGPGGPGDRLARHHGALDATARHSDPVRAGYDRNVPRISVRASRAPAPARESTRGIRDPEIRGDLNDLVEAVASLTPGECGRLHAFWRGTDETARGVAHDHAQAFAERSGRRDAIRVLQRELLDWSRTGASHRSGWVEAALGPDPGSAAGAPGRDLAVPAIMDAATALALQDFLDDADFDTLFGPWAHAMGGEDATGDGPVDPGPPLDGPPT